MRVGNTQTGASMGGSSGKKRIALKGIGPIFFAGIDVWFTGVAGGIDQELRTVFFNKRPQNRELGVIDFRARRSDKRNAALLQSPDKLLSNITCATQKNNHINALLQPEYDIDNPGIRNEAFARPVYPVARA